MNADARGYNPYLFQELGRKIGDSETQASIIIAQKLNEGLIIPISHAWYTQEGKDYFENLCHSVIAVTVKNQIEEIYQAFWQGVLDAGIVWADNTKNEAPTMPQLPSIAIQLHADNILPYTYPDRNVIIKVEECTAIADNLVNVKEQIIDEISKLHADLDSEAQFIGGEQSEAVRELFVRLTKIIDELFQLILHDDENSIYKNIKKAADKQAEVASNVATTFRNAGTESGSNGGQSSGSFTATAEATPAPGPTQTTM